MEEPIESFSGEHFFLSNFYKSEAAIWYNGLYFPTVENAYQAAKSNDRDIQKMFVNIKPGEAKRLGKKVTLRPNWERLKLSIMTSLIAQKFDNQINPEMVQLLIDTGKRELIEGNTWGDVYWGVCNGEGSNHLGQILMSRRTQLRYNKVIFGEY